jgi:hypothetical protein
MDVIAALQDEATKLKKQLDTVTGRIERCVARVDSGYFAFTIRAGTAKSARPHPRTRTVENN